TRTKPTKRRISAAARAITKSTWHGKTIISTRDYGYYCMRSVASPRRRSRRAPGCGRRSRLRILHLFHGRKPTTETTMGDEASGRAPDGNTVANEQPYDWDKCTVRLSITFLPGDGNEGGRKTKIGCNTHREPPLIEIIREAGLEACIR